MEFWQSIAVMQVDHLVEVAKIAEEVGFAGVTVADHLVKPREIRSAYPYTPDGKPFWEADESFPEPWVSIAAIAAETTRLRFLPYVYVLPIRDPFSVAKAVSSAAVLSGDRVILGVGVGWMEEEFQLAGQAFAAPATSVAGPHLEEQYGDRAAEALTPGALERSTRVSAASMSREYAAELTAVRRRRSIRGLRRRHQRTLKRSQRKATTKRKSPMTRNRQAKPLAISRTRTRIRRGSE